MTRAVTVTLWCTDLVREVWSGDDKRLVSDVSHGFCSAPDSDRRAAAAAALQRDTQVRHLFLQTFASKNSDRDR